VKRIQACPVCHNTDLIDLFECNDHMLSNDKFLITVCNKCKLLITNPQPDTSELARYYKSENYISHKANAKFVLDYVYMVARKFTVRSKLRILNQYPHNYTIMDYGCGTGDFLYGCKENGWTITGYEPSDSARKIAEQKLKVNILSNVEELKKKPFFSIITLWHVLEHIPNPRETIANLRNIVADNGKIIFALPNHESYDAKLYKEYWAAYDVPRHLYHFSKESMEYFLTKNGLRLDDVIPMKLDSYYISLMSEKYKTGSSNFFKAIISGYKSNIYGIKTGKYSSLIYVSSKC